MKKVPILVAKLKYIMGTDYPQSSSVMHAANISLLFAAIGVNTIALAVFYFLQIQREIREQNYRARRFFVLLLAALTGILGLTILWYLMQPTIAK